MNAPASFQIRPAQVEFALPLPKQTRAMNSITRTPAFTKNKIEKSQDVQEVIGRTAIVDAVSSRCAASTSHSYTHIQRPPYPHSRGLVCLEGPKVRRDYSRPRGPEDSTSPFNSPQNMCIRVSGKPPVYSGLRPGKRPVNGPQRQSRLCRESVFACTFVVTGKADVPSAPIRRDRH